MTLWPNKCLLHLLLLLLLLDIPDNVKRDWSPLASGMMMVYSKQFKGSNCHDNGGLLGKPQSQRRIHRPLLCHPLTRYGLGPKLFSDMEFPMYYGLECGGRSLMELLQVVGIVSRGWFATGGRPKNRYPNWAWGQRNGRGAAAAWVWVLKNSHMEGRRIKLARLPFF